MPRHTPAIHQRTDRLKIKRATQDAVYHGGGTYRQPISMDQNCRLRLPAPPPNNIEKLGVTGIVGTTNQASNAVNNTVLRVAYRILGQILEPRAQHIGNHSAKKLSFCVVAHRNPRYSSF
jgi:hypothetical protein